jgi:hypothetical protein
MPHVDQECIPALVDGARRSGFAGAAASLKACSYILVAVSRTSSSLELVAINDPLSACLRRFDNGTGAAGGCAGMISTLLRAAWRSALIRNDSAIFESPGDPRAVNRSPYYVIPAIFDPFTVASNGCHLRDFPEADAAAAA